MSKQYNVNLAFTADTAKAKSQMNDLQNQLQKLMSSSKLELGIEKEVQGANKAIAELSTHLQQATNMRTGTLDFSKFNQSIKQSGTSLQEYGRTLMSLGSQGQQAFMSLTQAVMNSEVPIRRTNTMLKEMGVTLANTVKWQLSSSMIHGFMGAVQSAYGYAQDLNASLNDIRIVTGQNVEQMARFATEANKAARALSSTTTEYTNASLIYYQQGLSDQQVKERTDITIKMANVAKQSAETVSDQMTAVWNNFYDGSKSLEHYADVMTALGAATASSTDEIAGGLEKFAAVADTIGLSYEYAASALATITSNTRQSEEVVGTALKTIFARIQGLKLGETLEDGLDLNKYSEALQTVGISVFDTNGELKRMDNILDEMGAKWDNLSKAQQVALAQTVAGVRQYNQLVSLMDEWDSGDSDSFMANLNTANTSSGALQEQADIYAESWEAAQDRVTAALEGVYNSLIKDEFFIDFLNSIEKIIGFVDDLIDRLGGLKGVMAAIGAIITKVFSEQLSKGLSNMAYNLKMMTEAGRQSVAKEKKAFITDAKERLANMEDDGSPTVHTTAAEAYDAQLSRQQQLLDNSHKLNEVEKQTVQMLMDQLKAKGDLAIATAKEVDLARQKQSDATEVLYAKASSKAKKAGTDFDTKVVVEQSRYLRESAIATEQLRISLEGVRTAGKASSQSAQEMKNIFTQLQTALPDVVFDKHITDANELIEQLQVLDTNSEEWKQTLEQIQGLMRGISQGIKDGAADALGANADDIDKYTNAVEHSTAVENKHKQSKQGIVKANKDVEDAINSAKGAQLKWSDLMVTSAQLAMNTAMAFSMLGSTIDTLKDPDASGWEKFTSVLMTFGMLVPTLISSWTALKTLISAETIVKVANALATLGQAAAERKLNKEKSGSYKITKENIKNTIEDTKNKVKNGAKNRGQSFKDNWNKTAFEKQGGTLHKNGTSSLKGRQGIVGKEETSKLLSSAGKSAAKGLGTTALSITAIAAGIAILAGGIAWGVKQAHKAEEAIKEAQKTVEELKTQLETVKSSYQEFSSQVSNFESASKGIEGLTKGTREYKDAVFEANQAAMALIESNKDLKYTVKDGVITFEDGELDRALKQSQQAVVAASAAKTAGDQALLKAQEAKSVRDMSRKIDSKSDNKQEIGNVLGAGGVGLASGAAIGAGIGGLVGGSVSIGILTLPAAAIGAIVGGIVGGIGGIVTGIVGNESTGAAVDAESEALYKIAKAYENDSSILAKDKDSLKEFLSKSIEEGGLGIDDADLVNALAEDTGALRELITEINANTAAINAQNDAIAAQALTGEDFVVNSEFADAIIDRSGDAYGNKVEEILNSESMKNLGTLGISKASETNAEAKKVFDLYLKSAGLSDKGYQLKDTKGTDSNREFIYLDENNNEQTVSLETMQYTIASAYALDELVSIARDISKDFNRLFNDKKDASSQALLSFLTTGGFGEATKEELDSLIKDMAAQGGAENLLKSFFGDDLQEVASRYGYSTAEEFITDFELAISQGSKEWNNINIEGLTEDIKKKLKLSAAKSFEEIQKFMDSNAEGISKSFSQMLDAIASQIRPEDQKEFLEKIINIDWSKFDAGYEVIDILSDMGYELDISSSSFEDWVNTINTSTLALYDFGAEMKNIEAIKESVEDLQVGDIISEEDYIRLKKFNSELANYFQLLATGEYRFVGDPLDLQQTIQEEEQNTYKKAIDKTEVSFENIKKRKEHQEIAEEYDGYNYLSESAGVTTTEKVKAKQVKAGYQAGADLINGIISSAGFGGGDGLAVMEDWFGDKIYTEVETGEVKEYFDLDKELYQKQIGFLKAVNADLEGIEQDLDKVQQADVDKVNEKIKSYTDQGVSDDEYEKAWAAQNQAELEYARSARDAQERDQMLDDEKIGEDMAALAGYEAHLAEKWEDIDPKEVEEYADSLMDAAKSSELLSDELANNIEAAEDVALYTKKMNQGIQKLSDGIEDWSSVINESDEASQEYSEAMKDVKNAMSDVLGVSEDFLSDQFIVDNMNDIKKAAEGDAEAIDRLAIAAGKDILVNLELEDENVREDLYKLHDQLAAEIPNIEVGATLNDGNFLRKAAEIVETAQMSVEQANAYFRSMGFEANFETKQVPVETKQPIVETSTHDGGTENVTYTQVNPDGSTSEMTVPMVKTIQTSKTIGYTTSTEMMEVPALTTDGGDPNFTLTRTNAGAMNNSSSSNPGGKKSGGGGGGGSKPKKTADARKSKDDYVERYKEINDQLDDVRDKMEDANRVASTLWGPARIKEMQKVSQQMEKELKLTRDQTKAAKEYLKLDKENLKDTLSDASADGVNLGFSFEALDFDANNNITNIESIENKIFEQREALLDSFGSEMDEGEQEQLEAFDKWADKFKEALSKYDDTKELIEDLENEAAEQLLAWQENNYEMLNIQLEVELTVDDTQLREVEYYLSKTSDDIWGMYEAAVLMTGLNADGTSSGQNSQLNTWVGQLDTYQQQYDDLVTQYTTIDPETGETYINQAQFIEGLQTLQDGLYGTLENLNQLDDSMIHYYGDTLAAAQEELSVYTDMMDHHNDTLDHYKNLLDLFGQSKDYEKMGLILEAQVETAENAAAVSKANYEMLAAEAEAKKAAWDAIQNDKTASDLDKEMAKQQWLDAQAAANQAQNDMLEDAEAWAQALKDVLENELAELADILDEALSGDFGSIDSMMTAMDRAKSLQEEFLTTTNQVYETNKLMNQAQQEIDKTTNTVAKRRMKSFIEETQNLQNKNKLSKFELEMQQAKYDLLLAEIALEEAQNAKSTVRLQRDSEGNFGYVYTADQNAVADAEQKVADAQNNLYNIGLEGANEYAEKYAQTIQEMNDAVTALTEAWLNNEIKSKEEYEQKMLELEEYYGEKLMQYSELRSIALTADTNIMRDAWSQDFASMTANTQQWMTSVDTYVQGVIGSFGRYQSGINTIETEVGLDLKSLKDKTKDITTENDNLAKSITKKGGLLDAMKKEITKVDNLTKEYKKLRKEIQDNIDAAEDLARAMGKTIETESDDDESNNLQPTNTKCPKCGKEGCKGDCKPDDGAGGGDTQGNNTLEAGDKVTCPSTIYESSNSKTGESTSYTGKTLYIQKINGKVEHKGRVHLGTEATYKKGSNDVGWVNIDDIKGYDTGGYTGEWGPDGKFAVLHEKEIVLNKEDTANLLSSMEVLNSIISTIDLYSANAQLGNLLSSPAYNAPKETETLEQNVHIEASFPGVSDHSEIEEALNNLVNKASQFIHRNK